MLATSSRVIVPLRSASIMSVISLLIGPLLRVLRGCRIGLDKYRCSVVDRIVKPRPAAKVMADYLECPPVLATPLGVSLGLDNFRSEIATAKSLSCAVLLVPFAMPRLCPLDASTQGDIDEDSVNRVSGGPKIIDPSLRSL